MCESCYIALYGSTYTGLVAWVQATLLIAKNIFAKNNAQVRSTV